MVIALYVWVRLRHAFGLFRMPPKIKELRAEDDLPSVSLCIPARNEVHAMTDCLENALLSHYPKLEIIVLDDASHDDTGNLIKSFAHAGVRFIEGSPLPDGWLGKNHALDGLAGQASGSLLLFADVDTRFSPDTIGQIVAYMADQSADMVSVMPLRYKAMRESAIFATLRHFWNLLAHDKQHPAVASSAWMIKRQALEAAGGFAGVASDVRPEKSLAALVAKNGVYRFIISTVELGVSYEKKLSSQYETAMRLYYPDFGAAGVIVRVLGLAVCIVPYAMVIVSLLVGDTLLLATTFGCCCHS